MIDDTRPNNPPRPRAAGRLLLTKLRAPRAASDGVVRERLMREIDRGVETKLTLIVTPPGYGKSTLVSQWQTQARRASAWLSLDAADNDVRVFLEYLTGAIQTIDATMCMETAGYIYAPSQPSATQLVALLINEIAESTQPFTLILDDYHVITSEEVQESVLQLLRRLPSNMSLILTSRKEPELPTLRMSARGELIELGSNELSFTLEETREFLIERQQLELDRVEVEKIEQWAEGWPVALRLVAGALRGRSQERIQTLLEALTENVPSVSDYLWDEAIENQPVERREFLLRTSILRQFNPEVAHQVTCIPDAEALLNSLARDNLFIARLYGPGSWYRYHHIFADVLRGRLVRDVESSELHSLHERAARWYEANQLTTEAAYHATQAQSWPLASRLLVQICKEFYDQERVGTLHRWLQNLPDEPLKIEPRLAYWLAWSSVRTGRAREAIRPIAIAEEAANEHAPGAEAARAALQLSILKSLFAWDLDGGESAAAELLEQLGPEDSTDRSRALIMLGMLRTTAGVLESSERALETARMINGRLGIRGLQLAELSATAMLQTSMGKLREPAELFRRIIAIGDEWNDLPLENALQRLGWIHYEWNQLDEAWQHADYAGQLAHRIGAPFHLAQIPALFARIELVRGNLDAAFDNIERAISASEAAGYGGIVPHYEELKCRMWLMTDQLTLAQSWFEHAGRAALQSERYQDLPSALTAIRVRIREGRPADTIEPLERLELCARANGWNRALLSIQIIRAVAESNLGNTPSASQAMDDALQLGAREGFVRSFLDEGPAVIPLLQHAARSSGPPQRTARSLLDAAGIAPDQPVTIEGDENRILSRRERDVMRLVANGLSNRDIGDALFISEETVKTHLRRIFEKLDVSSRTQAINMCQKLGLL